MRKGQLLKSGGSKSKDNKIEISNDGERDFLGMGSLSIPLQDGSIIVSAHEYENIYSWFFNVKATDLKIDFFAESKLIGGKNHEYQKIKTRTFSNWKT